MNVTLCSAFRNASGYIGRYFSQIDLLCWLLTLRGDRLYLVLGEGDSSDSTYGVLSAWANYFDAEIVTVNHGGPDFGSVVHPQRFANLAKVCNAIWRRIPQEADAVIWVESDLVWDAATMLALLDDLKEYPAVGPMVMLEREGYSQPFFYDTWAFRRNGKHFTHEYPFADWTPNPFAYNGGLQIDSAGSCLVMRGDIARQVSWPEEDVIVGLCRNIYGVGGSVWLDATQKVVHL